MDTKEHEAITPGNDKKRKPGKGQPSTSLNQQNPVSQSGSDAESFAIQKRQKMHDSSVASYQNANTGLNGGSPAEHNAEIPSLKVSNRVTRGSSLNVVGRLDVESLRNIMKTNILSNLLVDCRDAKSYNEERLRYSLNVPPLSSEDNKCWRFNSKKDVIMFLQERHPNIFGYLYSPGYYTYIIVFDQDFAFHQGSVFEPKPVVQPIPKTMNTLLNALVKWNENTTTKILLVDGGFEKSLFYCDRTDICKNDSIGWSFPVLVSRYKKPGAQNKEEESDEETNETENDNKDSEENNSGVNRKEKRMNSNDHTQVSNSSSVNPLSVECFSTHLKSLDSTTEKTWFLLVAKKQLMLLEGIKLALAQEEKIKSEKLVYQSVGDNLRCSVCRKIYSDKIFQCSNGHGLCEICTDTATICPICQTSCNIGTSNLTIFRNTMMEDMVTNIYKVDCPYTSLGCHMKRAVHKLYAHMKNCKSKPESPALSIIDGYIDIMKNEVSTLNQQLELYNNKMLKAEHKIFTATTQTSTKLQMQSIEDFKKKVNALKEAKVALMREIFSNGKPVTEKCNIFK